MNLVNYRLLPLFLAVILVLPACTTYKPTPPDSVNLMLAGDLMVGERNRDRLTKQGPDYFTDQVWPLTHASDLTIVNLESPITSMSTTSVEKTWILRSPPDLIGPILQSLQVDGVSLANNHIMDFEHQGLIDTFQHLDRLGIKAAGAGDIRDHAESPVFFERHGKTIGLLSFSNTLPKSFWATNNSPGSALGTTERVRKSVTKSTNRADYTVVAFHWGGELARKPRNYQVDLAHAAIDAGADVVFGHHPHVIQPVERYRDGIIFYSLGNFLFTTKSDKVNYGLLAEVRLTPSFAPDVRFHVLNINNFQVDYQPHLVRAGLTVSQLQDFLESKPGINLEKILINPSSSD